MYIGLGIGTKGEGCWENAPTTTEHAKKIKQQSKPKNIGTRTAINCKKISKQKAIILSRVARFYDYYRNGLLKTNQSITQ